MKSAHRTVPILAGLTLVALGSAAGAMAGGMPALLATRLIEAFGFALTVTSMPAFVQSRAAPDSRGLAMGLWSTWMPAGIALMMAISWLGLDALGWRGMFWLCAAIPAVAALLLLVDPSARSGNAPQGPKTAARELLRGQAARTAGIFASFSAGYLAITAFLPTILFDLFAMPAPRAALVGFASALALIPGNIAGGWLVGRGWHRRGILGISLSGMIAAAAILLSPGFGLAACVSAAIAFGAFSGAPPGVLWASIPILAPNPADAPIVSGAFFQSAGIGQVLGPILAGLAVQASGNWSSALWVVGAMLAASLVLSLGIRRDSNGPTV